MDADKLTYAYIDLRRFPYSRRLQRGFGFCQTGRNIWLKATGDFARPAALKREAVLAPGFVLES